MPQGGVTQRGVCRGGMGEAREGFGRKVFMFFSFVCLFVFVVFLRVPLIYKLRS